MKKTTIKFSNSSTVFYFDASFSYLEKIVAKKHAVILTDENIFSQYSPKFKGWNTIVLKAGEDYKVQATVDAVIEQLIGLQCDRKTTLIGVGGGVITDLAGYVAGIFMRGIPFGFVPTSLLAMVDAAIGGKNGIDVGVYKNMVGTIRQPGFLLYDVNFLKSLPSAEWSNGFAEIIKHACIKDAAMFRLLEQHDINSTRKNKKLLAALVERNAKIKIKTVQADEFEKGERKLLNFGHTLGHALENQYELSHGQAVAIGMAYACTISSKLIGFKQTAAVVKLLQQFDLPAHVSFNKQKVFNVLRMDKKREQEMINYILLERTGKAIIHPMKLDELESIFNNIT